MAGVKKGNIPWNKGVTGYKTSKPKGKCDNTGKTHFKKGHVPWNKDGHFVMSNQWKENIKKATIGVDHNNKGHKHTQEWKDERSRWMKSQSREFYAKCLRRKSISSLEEAYMKLFIKHKVPYKFVGNGEFWIGKKNPDFIHSQGEKIAIEVFYRKHKDIFRGGVEMWKDNRRKYFREHGWKVIFLEPTDLLNNLLFKKGGERINSLITK